MEIVMSLSRQFGGAGNEPEKKEPPEKISRKNPEGLRGEMAHIMDKAGKVSVTIRLDRRIIDKAKLDGPGWQSRLNEFLIRNFL
jgi:uncharacterized protein (DUF4415 family)